jgi:hypothetical protein
LSARSARAAPPAAVDVFAEALAEWLSSFTVPQELAAEMASACSAGAPWAAAIAGTSVRRAGWPEQEALAWGIAIGALAGALEAGRRSLAEGGTMSAGSEGSRRSATAPARAADGPALPLLAADGLIAGAHEAISSLDAERLVGALEALDAAFGDGGPWRHLRPDWPRPAWPTVAACALGPAARDDPGGPWEDLAVAWRTAFAAPSDATPESKEFATAPDERLRSHADADRDTNELFAFAADAARGRDSAKGADVERF